MPSHFRLEDFEKNRDDFTNNYIPIFFTFDFAGYIWK